LAPVFAATLLAALVAWSRLMSRVHSVSEVAGGIAFGLLGAGLYALALRSAWPAPSSTPLPGAWLMAAGMLTLLLVTEGRPAPTQALLMQLAQALSGQS